MCIGGDNNNKITQPIIEDGTTNATCHFFTGISPGIKLTVGDYTFYYDSTTQPLKPQFIVTKIST